MSEERWLTTVLNQANTNLAIYEMVKDKSQLDVLIKDIESDFGSIQIEVLQFVSLFSFFESLDKQRKNILQKMAEAAEFNLHAELEKELEEIEQQQITFIRQVLTAVQIFAKTKYTTSIADAALKFFQGDIAAANALIDPELLIGQQSIEQTQEKLKIKLEAVYEKLEENASEFRIKGQLNMLDFTENKDSEDQFQRSYFYFKRGLKSARRTKRDWFTGDYLLDLAYFLQENNHFSECQPIYEEALAVYQNFDKLNMFDYINSIGVIQNNLALLKSDQNDYWGAERLYLTKLTTMESFSEAETKEVFFQAHKSGLLNNLGRLYYHMNNFDLAEKHYLNALHLNRSLVKKMPEKYKYKMAISLDNLGVLYYQYKDFTKAAQFQEEALPIRVELAEKGALSAKSSLAFSYGNLANLKQDQGDFRAAKKHLDQADRLFSELAQLHSHKYLPDLAKNLLNQGGLYKDLGLIEQTRAIYNRANAILEKLIQKAPQIYRPLQANAKTRLGDIAFDSYDYNTAFEHYLTAYEIRKDIAKDNPDFQLDDLARSLNSLGKVFEKTKIFDHAKDVYLRAVEILQPLVAQNPKAYNDLLASTLNNLGLMYMEEKAYKNAAHALIEAFGIYTNLYSEQPDYYRRGLAMIFHNLADNLVARKDYTTAEDYYQNAIGLRALLVEESEQIHLHDLATSLNNYGNFLTKHGAPSEAEEFFLEALGYYEKLIHEFGEIYLKDLAQTQISAANYFYIVHVKRDQAKQLIKGVLDSLSTQSHIPEMQALIQLAALQWCAWGEDVKPYLQLINNTANQGGPFLKYRGARLFLRSLHLVTRPVIRVFYAIRGFSNKRRRKGLSKV